MPLKHPNGVPNLQVVVNYYVIICISFGGVKKSYIPVKRIIQNHCFEL